MLNTKPAENFSQCNRVDLDPGFYQEGKGGFSKNVKNFVDLFFGRPDSSSTKAS